MIERLSLLIDEQVVTLLVLWEPQNTFFSRRPNKQTLPRVVSLVRECMLSLCVVALASVSIFENHLFIKACILFLKYFFAELRRVILIKFPWFWHHAIFFKCSFLPLAGFFFWIVFWACAGGLHPVILGIPPARPMDSETVTPKYALKKVCSLFPRHTWCHFLILPGASPKSDPNDCSSAMLGGVPPSMLRGANKPPVPLTPTIVPKGPLGGVPPSFPFGTNELTKSNKFSTINILKNRFSP